MATLRKAAIVATTTMTADLHVFVRIHGKAGDREVLIGQNGNTEHQVALPIFKQAVDYCDLLHRTLATALPPTLPVSVGAGPKEPYYYDAANVFVTTSGHFGGFELEHTDVFYGQPSYWDGTRWIRPANFVAFAYPFIRTGATASIEKLLKGKTKAKAPESLFADFILTLQHI